MPELVEGFHVDTAKRLLKRDDVSPLEVKLAMTLRGFVGEMEQASMQRCVPTPHQTFKRFHDMAAHIIDMVKTNAR